MNEPKYPVPESTQGDANHAAVKGFLAAIPGLGGLAAEVFQFVVQAPIEQRRNEWMAKLGEDLQRLQEQGVKLEELQSNQQFISLVMHASQIAIRSHQEEKLEALRNAVKNAADGWSSDDAEMHMFLGFVDTLTPAHLRMLRAIQRNTFGTDFKHLLQRLLYAPAVKRNQGPPPVEEVLLMQLVASGLVHEQPAPELSVGVKPSWVKSQDQQRAPKIVLAPLGHRFLRFISPDAIAKTAAKPNPNG